MSIFKPYSWTQYNWIIFDTVSNFLKIVFLIFFNQVEDLSRFFLKHILWIPSSHYILLTRALFLFSLGMLAIREFY